MKKLTLTGKTSSRLGEMRARRQRRTQETSARRARSEALDNYAEHLRNTYPGLFDPEKPKPLSMGVHRELAASRPEYVSMKTMRLFLYRHTHSMAYLKALAMSGAQRYGLEGVPVGPVTHDHQINAKRALAGQRAPAQRARRRR